MPDPRPITGGEPSPGELTEILAQLEFFLRMDEADTLPLEEDSGKEGGDDN